MLSTLESHEDDEFPYEDPYFWAGFVFSGKDTEAGTASPQKVEADGVVMGRDADPPTLVLSEEQLSAIGTLDADRSNDQKRLITLLEEKVNLRDAQLRSALMLAKQADVPTERYGEKLFEFATSAARLRDDLDRIAK